MNDQTELERLKAAADAAWAEAWDADAARAAARAAEAAWAAAREAWEAEGEK